MGVASYPRLLYGVSDGYTPDESNVIGLHYMRVGDGDMARSEPTDENGRFDPIMTNGKQAGTVIFAIARSNSMRANISFGRRALARSLISVFRWARRLCL